MLVLVRHGESEGNAAGLLLGRGEWPLTERGRAQAGSAAELLAGCLSGVVSSPVGRARATAAILAERAGVDPVVIDERWAELDYGTLDGMPLAEVPPSLWRQWQADIDFAPPGGESLADLGRRVRSACQDLAGADGPLADPDRHLAVVSHVSPVKAAVAWALGVDDRVAWRMHLVPGGMTVIGWTGDRPTLRTFGVPVDRPVTG